MKRKIFRESYPYICKSCGQLSNFARELCEECGSKNSLRKTTREDYKKYIEKFNRTYKKPGIHPDRKKKIKAVKMILVIFFAFLIIDFIGSIIIMNILNISFDQIGDYMFIFLILLGFSLFLFIIIVIGIYWTYIRARFPF